MAADADRGRRVARPAADDGSAALGLGTGWAVFSYLISGMIAYGAIGWGIGRAVHAGWLFPVGMIVGMAIAVGYVIYRYGRQGSVEQQFSATKGTRAGGRE
jgi:ATP synthase protein I